MQSSRSLVRTDHRPYCRDGMMATRDLERRYEELSAREVEPEALREAPVPEPPAEDAGDLPRKKSSPLLLVLAIANLVLLSGLTLVVLLLFLGLKGGSLS